MLNRQKLGFIGAGNMAEAIARGVIGAGMIPAADVFAFDPSEERRKVFSEFGVSVCESAKGLAECDIILLAVKPQVMFTALESLVAFSGPDKLVITIAAGITTQSIAQKLKEGTRIVRVMPNTPMLSGAGMSGVCKGPAATDADLEVVLNLCAAAGEACEVTEELMDAVTAVSGSGPAYFFLLTELLEQAAVDLGIEPAQAAHFARQTFIGAATLLANSSDSAAELRRKVTSPKGTTEAAVNSMIDNGLAKVIRNGVTAARDRGRELSAGK